MSQRFQMINLKSTQHYLRIKVIRNDDSILLRQRTYLTKILKRFNMNKCKIVESLMKSNLATVMIFTKKDQIAHYDIIK